MLDVMGPVRHPARISSIGAYVPDRVVTNAELETMLDTSDVWIQKKTGIRERRIAAADELASDMACHAVLDACRRADVAVGDLDMLVLGTWTADHLNPPTSAAVLRKLGISVPAFDVHSGGCAGGVLALDVGAKYAACSPGTTVAVVLAEVNSKMLDWEDRSTAVFLGDGAACYIVRSGEVGLVRTKSVVLPEHYELAWVPSGGRASSAVDSPASAFFRMDGPGLWDALHSFVPGFVDDLLGPAFERSAVDLVVWHQANLRLVESLMEACGFSMDQTVTTVEEYGNTAGASVPLTLHRAIEVGRLNRGDTVLLVAFGAGITVAASLWEW